MHSRQGETERFANREQIQALHLKFIALAKFAKEKGDGILSESHYQRAEYYLHAMNEQGSSNSVGAITAITHTSGRALHSTQKVIKNLNLKRINRKNLSNTQEKPAHEGNVLRVRGHYLHRNRRRMQSTEKPE